MIDANRFFSELSELRISLEIAEAETEFIEATVREANTSLRVLQAIEQKNLSATEREAELRSFLRHRGEYIQGSGADYLSLPYSPINRLCIKFLQGIIKKDESLLKILCPFIH